MIKDKRCANHIPLPNVDDCTQPTEVTQQPPGEDPERLINREEAKSVGCDKDAGYFTKCVPIDSPHFLSAVYNKGIKMSQKTLEPSV